MELHGLIPIDKPLGWTSHDVISRLRRILNTRRVGHAGSLDPAATGVLVVGVGRATRFLDYVQGTSKGYAAHVVLGSESESADIDGRITSRTGSDCRVYEETIRRSLQQFIGEIDQVPPKYSAVKIAGEPLYRRARRGETVDVPVRRVRVDEIRLVHYQHPDVMLSIECGSGVYVRSLARDIGESLGCGAYLHHLLRTRVGSFTLPTCWRLEQLATRSFPTDWSIVASAADVGLGPLPAFGLDREDERSWYHGRSIRADVSGDTDHGFVRCYTVDGDFVGLGTLDDPDSATLQIRPRIVLTAD